MYCFSLAYKPMVIQNTILALHGTDGSSGHSSLNQGLDQIHPECPLESSTHISIDIKRTDSTSQMRPMSARRDKLREFESPNTLQVFTLRPMLSSLPNELLLKILEYLNARDILSCCTVSYVA